MGTHEHFVPHTVWFQVWGTLQSLPTQTLTSHARSPTNPPSTPVLGTSYQAWIHHPAAQSLAHHFHTTTMQPNHTSLFNKRHPAKAPILGGSWATSTHQFANTEIIPSGPSVKNGFIKIENPLGTLQDWILKTNFSSPFLLPGWYSTFWPPNPLSLQSLPQLTSCLCCMGDNIFPLAFMEETIWH